MSFVYPLGLLGLIGVPILVIIYIIKNKYTEQTVSSTYLWNLSERFTKRRRRRNPLDGLIPLILQILSVVLISLVIAHPIIRMPGSAKEYTFLLDASGSMSMETDGKTRFERGKEEIARIIEDASEGSSFSLVQLGTTTSLIYERVTDKSLAAALLADLRVSHGTGDETDALGIAQGYFNENAGMLTYLVTDTAYAQHDNVTVINVAEREINYALSDVSHTFLPTGLLVTGKATVYGAERGEITLALTVDGGAAGTKTLALTAGEETPFEFLADADYFESLKVEITNTDALALDNVHMIYDIKSTEIYNTLIVSDRPFFIEMAVKNLGYRNITVLSTAQYRAQTGFGLYIFDTYSPASAPTDGTVWLINPDGKLDDMGFGVRDVIDLEVGEEMVLSDSSASLVRRLTEGVEGHGLYLTRYVECGLYRNFSTLLSYNQNPLLFAGTTHSGNREVVFAFDLHDSNMVMTTDYVVLMGNLLRYSFPEIMEKVNYTVGEEAEINIPASTKSIKVEAPSGEVTYLNTGAAVASFVMSEAGIYCVTLDADATLHLYSSLPTEESQVLPVAESMSVLGEATDDGPDGIFDPMSILFIVLALVFLADWMVYCYEKYQLR